MTKKTAAAFFLLFLFAACSAGAAAEKEIRILLEDDAPYHVHSPNKFFSVSVRIKAPQEAKLSYYWQDVKGNPLTSPRDLPTDGSRLDVQAPSNQEGYYGLVFKANPLFALPDRQKGESREYGFVVLPRPKKTKNNSPFGVVHADKKDPYLPPWIKTATWTMTSSTHWLYEMDNRRHLGKTELPIIYGSPWDSDDTRPISRHQLEKIRQKAHLFFSADPSVDVWEAGLEENIKRNYEEKYYWQNLEKKFKSLQHAVKESGSNIKLAYQIVGTSGDGIEHFFNNGAYRYVDIIALHPYAWPDFPSPENWLEPLLTRAAHLQKKHNTHLPIWFTEVGAPHFGNYQGGFFGYPEDDNKTSGLSKGDAVNYMVKLCVIARSMKVEKIFWYNYQDQSPSRQEAEAHFGLRDFWGYPKPVYAAYAQIHRLLGTAEGKRIDKLPDDIEAYVFPKDEARLIILWRKKGKEQSFSLSRFEGFGDKSVVTDAVGHPVALDPKGNVLLGAAPLFIKIP